MPVTWLMALKAAAAITWRSLVANLGIVVAAILVSLLCGLEIGVHSDGMASLSFEWSRPFGTYVAIAQVFATVWAVKRSVEIAFPTPALKLSLTESAAATWSFAWRHFIAVFGVAAILYLPIQRLEPSLLRTATLAFLAVWSVGPSFLWAVRGMLRVEAKRISA